ncbi:ABC transporter permease [Nitrincola alkalilacustris]|uniref:ABC transporter permease n=1 Tax=Nitrincola alkalilacustris TaxID=1571224 RepID=UPI001F0F15F9|nr:ABC transporter permease [Nitrincola alkalilacustris]
MDLLQLNLGNSLITGAPVITEIQHQLSHSLLLAVTAIAVAALLALPLGILTGFRAGGRLDKLVMVISSAFRAQPVFVVGLILILLFSVNWQWFPVAGFGSLYHLVLPSLALALCLAAVSNRVVRNSTQRVVNSPFYLFSRVKGLPAMDTFMRHGLRNLSVPVIAYMGIQLVGLIEGIVMIESLFSWPGVGHGLAHAIFSRDIPMIQGTALMMGLIFVILNALVDVACYLADPRGRLQ